MHPLSNQLQAAHDRRQPWLSTLEDTTAYRLFHGAVEGTPGLTVDRYGPVLLVQSFRAPLDPAARGALDAFAATLPEIEAVAWNHRGRSKVEPEPLAGAVVAEPPAAGAGAAADGDEMDGELCSLFFLCAPHGHA